MTSSLAESLGAGHTASGWATDFLTAIGAPASNRNVNAVVAWENQESGGGGGRFNPLNTTQTGYVGETPANYNNGHPVLNYTTYADGLAANAQAFNSGARKGLYGYDQILAALNSKSASVSDIFAAIDASSWGTKGLPTNGAAAPTQDTSGTNDATLTSADGSAATSSPPGSRGCIEDKPILTFPGSIPNFTHCNGRAVLGFACLLGGGLLVALGLTFVAVNSKAGKAARAAVPIPLPA